MRGEYKVPGGKLVAADVTVEDGRLAQVSVSGDFFLEPDDALERIDSALTGLPETSSVAQLTDAITSVLDDSIAMIGFSPEAIGIAVRRALGKATSWHDHTFEVVHDEPVHPAIHVALDEVIANEVGAGRRGPTLRFWEWNAPAVVIGSFQSLRNEVDLEAVERYGVTVLRRISGGGAMFMEPGNTITYSLTVPQSLVEGLSFERSYSYLDDWIIGGLKDLGIEAKYVPLNDITSPAGKIAGAAQKRLSSGAVLHHVTMAYDMDQEKMAQVLRVGREKLSDKGTKSAKKRVDPLRSQTGMPRGQIITALKEYFTSRYNTVPGEVTADEMRQAEELVATKFTNPQWTARVP